MHHLRVLDAGQGVYAFYDGRIEDERFAEGSNWVDDGALSLGIASYAVVSGRDALVYDTHVSVERALHIRRVLENRGVRRFRVVLSHWHLDHVAGTAAFRDGEIVASERTREVLTTFKPAIERGELEGPPAINPLQLPTTTFDDRMPMTVGRVELELIHTNIHSDDATVVWMPHRKLLLCGDTMEDTVTYVDEPQSFETHLRNLAGLRQLAPDRILPNHGDPQVIADGGYSRDLIDATEQYIQTLQRCPADPRLCELSLRDLVAGPLQSASTRYFAPYEAVHRHNVDAVLAAT